MCIQYNIKNDKGNDRVLFRMHYDNNIYDIKLQKIL